MSIYGWAWGHGRLVPAKPAERMSMDEALRGICFGAVLDISRCQQCGGKCAFGERVLELMEQGVVPAPTMRPDPTPQDRMEARKLSVNAHKRQALRSRQREERRRRVAEVDRLRAQGMTALQASIAAGYANEKCYYKAKKDIEAQERWKNV